MNEMDCLLHNVESLLNSLKEDVKKLSDIECLVGMDIDTFINLLKSGKAQIAYFDKIDWRDKK